MKAIAQRVSIVKGDDAGKTPELFRLTDIEPQFVSLVTAGANRQSKFQVVKADEAEAERCEVCDVDFVSGACPECGKISEKAVPPKDAEPDEKRDAQKQRADQYGIEALEEGANLSYPAGDPTIEAKYGDPVNLKYPFGYDDNEPDLGRLRNGIVRFKQHHESYSQDASKGVVFGRIVDASLDAGIDVSYDKDDVVDRLLPDKVKQRLDAGKDDSGADGGTQKDSGTTDLSWLDKACESVDSLLLEAQVDHAGVIAVDGVFKQADTGEPRNRPSVKLSKDNLVLTQKLDKANARIVKLEAGLKAAIDMLKVAKQDARTAKAKLAKYSNGLGGATAIVVGTVSKGNADTPVEKGDEVAPWAGGGDLAAL